MALSATAFAACDGRRACFCRGRVVVFGLEEEETAKSQCVEYFSHLNSTKLLSDIVYSQPADTGAGNNVNTQLFYAVSHLKSTGNPMRLQDLAIFTNTPLDTDKVLLEKFKAHDRVVHDPKTDLYSYRVGMLRMIRQLELTWLRHSTTTTCATRSRC